MLPMLGAESTGMTSIIANIPTMFGLINDVISAVTGNPVLLFFATIPVACIAIKFLRKLVGAAGSM